jgi:Zinc carboxypeptidase
MGLIESFRIEKFLVLGFLMMVLGLPAESSELNRGVALIDMRVLFPGATFQSEIPSQYDVTGVKPGERPLRPEEALAFYSALAEASPRARLIEYARSHEGRPLVALAVSDEQTIARLDEFQREHADLLDPRTGGVPAVSDLAGAKAVAWMAYGIHGDELSSTDAAVALAYWLVAGQDSAANDLREKLVVLIDPNENPDGRSRYLAQTMSFAHRTANPDQDDLSHRAVWPWGRGNHYLFDMNRDWFIMTQPESARTEHIARWLPQVLVDSHEMGANSSYLFPPPRHPFNPYLPPNTQKWEVLFAGDQAKALDNHGFPYFSGEWNEEFFPGYGSSWVSYQGTIGILYEMSRTSGTLVRKRGGTLRTFAQAVEHQVTSSVANLSTLAGDPAQILHDHISARQTAIDNGSKGPVKAWVFPPDPRHPERAGKLAGLLVRQGIEVQVLSGKSIRDSGLRSVSTGEKNEIELVAGTFMVRLDQPSGFMVHALLDPHVAMETEFFQEEREYLEKGKGSRLYETTAWSLALTRGTPFYWKDGVPDGTWLPYKTEAQDSPPSGVPSDFTSLIIDGDPDTAPRVLADLLQGGINVRVAQKPFTVEGKSYHRGALVIRKESNEHHLIDRLKPIAERHNVAMIPVSTSRSKEGPDLGGRHFDVLVEPRVGVLAGMPISPTDFGVIWHLLDQELDLRFSSIDVGRFGRVDLSRYNVLVFPSVMGGPAMYRQTIGPGGMENLRQWVKSGGTAIGFGGGAKMLADEKTELTSARFRSQTLAVHPSPVWSLSAEEAESAGRAQATGLRVAAARTEEEPAASVGHGSLYDIAPILGPGALPFSKGHEQGMPLKTQPMPMSEWIKSVLPPGRLAAEEGDLALADARLRRFMPQGALLRADLDPEFWLNFGLADNIAVWFGGDDTIIASSPVTIGALFPEVERMHLGGLLWPEGAMRMAHTAYATRERVGKGQVILFAANPVFRRWMQDTERMFMNAVLLGPGLGTRWSTPW